MRIPLADESERPRGRPQARRSKRRSRTFESAISLPQAPSRKAGTATRPGRRAQPAGTTRQRRKTGPSAGPAARVRKFSFRAVLRRMPVFLLLVALLAIAAYASVDPRFFVYEAQIVGAQRLGADPIYQAAGVHEQNIFWIDPEEVARRVAELDGIKEVRVRCSLPAAVIIEVKERQPALMWRAVSQGRDWWLDDEGVVLPYHGDANSPETLFVVDNSARQLATGGRIEPEGLVQSVLQLAAGLPEVRIFYYGERGLSFTQKVERAEWPVYVGSSEDLPRKIQVMQTLTAYLKSNGIQPRYVDVRWAEYPVYGRPAGETAGGGE